MSSWLMPVATTMVDAPRRAIASRMMPAPAARAAAPNASLPAPISSFTSMAPLGLVNGWIRRASEGLDPRPDLDLPGPRVTRLADEVEIALRDRIRIKRGVASVGIGPARRPNAPVDDDMADVNALRMQLARHGLREAPQRELSHGEGRGARISLHARGSAGEDNRALAARQHGTRRLLTGKKRTERRDLERAANLRR